LVGLLENHLSFAPAQAAGKMKHAEKVFSVTLIPHDQAPKILQPGPMVSRFSSVDGLASNNVRLVF
jgi:hypothetical protein